MGSEGFLRYWKVPHSFGKEDSRSILEAAEGSRHIGRFRSYSCKV